MFKSDKEMNFRGLFYTMKVFQFIDWDVLRMEPEPNHSLFQYTYLFGEMFGFFSRQITILEIY